MKALSLTQPWASAIALGIKQWETRSWATHFRGEVCIHAAKGFPRFARDFAASEAMMGRVPRILPFGVIVAVADLTECRQTETVLAEIGPVEQLYGDYSQGRYAFKLENIRVLDEPVSVIGHLGFWSVPWEPAVAVIRALKRSGGERIGVE